MTRNRHTLRGMRYGICLANIGSFADPRVAVRFAQAAEASGWEGVFVWDHLAFVWGPPAADPWITLAAIASATQRVRLGTMVTPVARRRPHVLAQQVATLDVLSGGRVVFGAGLGGSASEFGKFGEPTAAATRAEMLDEGLDVLRRLWSGDTVDHRGAHYVVEGVTLAPTPLQQHLRIWIGGNRPASLRRAARWDGWVADGAAPSGMPLTADDVARSIDTIGRGNGYDIAVLGERGRGNPDDYAQAGATWWLENVHDRRGSPEELLGLVEAGPS